jgi:N-carbamoyl-L-amino-acid hydrolase
MCSLKVNFQRLRQDLASLAEIGKAEDQGVYRMAFSAADMQARDWLRQRIESAGLDYYMDGAANVHARLNWNEDKASVMTGSHIDSVPGGGQLDGALGVVAGLECLRSLKEQNVELARPLELVAFSDEEGRFGGIFGSSAICGQLTPKSIYNSRDLDGFSISDAMAHWGMNAMDALNAARPAESIHAFVELHIEQGPVLDKRKIKIGVVDAIAGLFKWNVQLSGMASHAGSTPMDMRQDAFQGLAEFSGEIPRILEEHGSPTSVATIGRVELLPGAANVVPGMVEFSLDVRETNREKLEELASAFRRAISAIARRRDLMFEFEVLSDITPVKCDPGIMQIINEAARTDALTTLQMPSGAAHDTEIMSSITRAGLIFVPSKDGRSHSPAEWTALEDIENGANVLLNTLYQLANEK